MRTILISTPRAGSHARCSQFDNPLYECLSPMDLLLPREESSKLNLDILSDDFNKALGILDWDTAYDLKPNMPDNHHILDYDENMQQIKRYEYPSKEYVLNIIQIRIDRLKLLDNWCVKIMRYHGLKQHHIEQLLNISDKTIKLQRKSKVDQCISQYLATYDNIWHNAQDEEVHSIDYEYFRGIVQETTKDDIWTSSFDHITTEYYEDLDLSTSNWQKNNIQVDYDRQICSNIVNTFLDKQGQAMNISESFEKELLNTDWSSYYDIVSDTGYLKSITTSMDYWQVHMKALDKIGINVMSKDIQWLDIGVWFGVMPYIMQKLGFTNIDTTDCYNHRTSLDGEFQQLWKLFNLNPQELEVLPQQDFKLNKKYDLITIFKSNLYWKTQDVIHYDGKTLNREWQTQGKDDKHHTYFTVYDQRDWDILFKNLRKHLNPGGVAIINPEPWVYDSFENLGETKQWLERTGVYKEDYKLNELSKYLVVFP